MELKLRYIEDGNLMITGLNRTFYGIETRIFFFFPFPHFVLIVPFMELKHGSGRGKGMRTEGLNRTFYGIETGV